MAGEFVIGAALLAGLAGSVHCVAMCGGMAGLIAAKRDAHGGLARRTLTYNSGRIVSYSVAGMLAGGLGRGIGVASGLDVAAGHMRMVSGVIIVLAGLYILTGRQLFAPLEKFGARIWKRMSPLAVAQLRKNGTFATFSLGVLWGWLPCGLTWSMLAIATAGANPWVGAGVMAAFGIGTLPAMLASGLAGFRLRTLLNQRSFRQSAAALMIVAGIWTAAFPIVHTHILPAATEHHHH